ncbi:MAG: 4Fe-4S dicluster domain-containing protein [Candidatus Gastranaerophilales bacterium]|nr:4Fe-4S dicluster domain-containing protein [Candidatus Gastranaerophilales bacterium]
MNINEKLATLKYNKGKESHLYADNTVCRNCSNKFCTYICPAGVYVWDKEKNELIIRYENCLECGACKIACEKKNIIWKYPEAEYGVKFKNG